MQNQIILVNLEIQAPLSIRPECLPTIAQRPIFVRQLIEGLSNP